MQYVHENIFDYLLTELIVIFNPTKYTDVEIRLQIVVTYNNLLQLVTVCFIQHGYSNTHARTHADTRTDTHNVHTTKTIRSV